MKHNIHTLFKAGDGRVMSDHVVSIREGMYARVYSEGWDCSLKGEQIDVWMIPYVPASDCETAIAIPYLERIYLDCCTTYDKPKFQLDKGRTFDTLEEQGAFILRRKCGAENVNVYIQYMKGSQAPAAVRNYCGTPSPVLIPGSQAVDGNGNNGGTPTITPPIAADVSASLEVAVVPVVIVPPILHSDAEELFQP